MPRNVSGTYSLPLPPVVANTVIQSAWANTTTDDIAQGITDSLDRNGRGGMITPFRLVDGSELQPAFAFSSETGTGLWRESPGLMAVSVMGVKVASWSGTDYTLYSNLAFPVGFGISGDLGVVGDVTLTGNVGIGGVLQADGGIVSLDDVSVTENFDGSAGFFATNLSALTHAYAGFQATNNLGHVFGLAALGSGNTDWPVGDTGVLYSDTVGGISLINTNAAATMRFYTASTERMRIDNSGWVGIGMVPLGGAKLDVKGLIRQINDTGTLQGIRLLNSTQANGLTVGVQEPPNNSAIISSDTAAMTFFVGGSERMRVDTSGNVGIGAASAGNRLHVAAANAQGGVAVFNVGASTSTPLALTNGADADFNVRITGVGAATKLVTIGTSVGATNAPLAIQTLDATRIQINTSGEIGINGINNPADSSWVQIFAAGKVPSLAFIKSGIQGWYIGGDKTGASNRFDISANGGPLLTIQPGSGYVGLGNTTGQDMLSLGSYGTGAVTEMAVYGPYGSASLANVYVGTMGNGGGKVELNGHTSASTLASWQMLHHSDIAGQDLIFRYSSGGATRPFTYSDRFRISSSGAAAVYNSVGGYYVAVDPGPVAASIPIGAIVFGQAVIAGGGAALTGLGTFVCGVSGQQISWGAYTGGGGTTTITHGTWRNIGAQTAGGVGLFMRVG